MAPAYSPLSRYYGSNVVGLALRRLATGRGTAPLKAGEGRVAWTRSVPMNAEPR